MFLCAQSSHFYLVTMLILNMFWLKIPTLVAIGGPPEVLLNTDSPSEIFVTTYTSGNHLDILSKTPDCVATNTGGDVLHSCQNIRFWSP